MANGIHPLPQSLERLGTRPKVLAIHSSDQRGAHLSIVNGSLVAVDTDCESMKYVYCFPLPALVLPLWDQRILQPTQ